MTDALEPCQSIRVTHTAHAVGCARRAGHKGQCVFADGNGFHVWLDADEVSNLRALLDAIREARLPVMNGDWFEQLRVKLAAISTPNNPPNEPVEVRVARINAR